MYIMYINGTYDILISRNEEYGYEFLVLPYLSCVMAWLSQCIVINIIILISGQFIVIGCRICVLGNWVIFGLSICSGPFWHEGIAHTNTDIPSTRPFWRNLSEISSITQNNSFTTIYLKLPIPLLPYWSVLNMLIIHAVSGRQLEFKQINT